MNDEYSREQLKAVLNVVADYGGQLFAYAR